MTFIDAFPWVLSSVSLTVLYLAPRRPRAAWTVGLVSQVLWTTYAIVSSNLGFILSVVPFTAVYIGNLRRAMREEGQ